MSVVALDAATHVHYRCSDGGAEGEHPDLVLVHGTGGSSQLSWGHLIEPLGGGAGGRRRIITVDLSGSGDTTDDGAPLTVEALARQVRAAIDDAGGRPFDCLGFSLGAVVSAYLAAELPAGLRRLILLSGWARSADDARLGLEMTLWQRLVATDPEALATLLAMTGYSPAWLARRPVRALEQAVAQTVATLAPGFARQAELNTRVDLTAQLARIAVPTLVLGAADDQMVPFHHSEALAAEIPGARLEALPTGHLSIYEAPARLVERVLGFLEDGAAQ